jgi:hypothetical protein
MKETMGNQNIKEAIRKRNEKFMAICNRNDAAGRSGIMFKTVYLIIVIWPGLRTIKPLLMEIMVRRWAARKR